MRRLIVWGFFAAVLAVPLTLVVLLVLCIEDRPTISRSVELTPQQTEHAKRILEANDPRKAPPNALRTFTIAAEDLDLVANFLLAQAAGGGATIALTPGAATLTASAKLPVSWFGGYLNVHAIARQTSAMPALEQLRVGRLEVPGFIADRILALALGRFNGTAVGATAADTLRTVRITPRHLVVEYQWRPDLADRLRFALLPPGEAARLRAYQDRLVELTGNAGLAQQISLVELLRPLIAHAASRSLKADAAAENRSAIIALAFYVNGHGLAAIVPAAKDWPTPSPRNVTLGGRHDFSQHFTISAAISATAGTQLADAIGVYKELDDAKEGSGFSFTDIAADRAGTVFGKQATRSPDAARALQARVRARLAEPEFMPRADDLPEMMHDAEFKQRFGGVGAPAYRQMMATIEKRVAALALYR